MPIKRGDIWSVNLDPTLGAEIRKTRPVIVVSSDAVGALPLKLVAPLTEWKDYLTENIWHVKVVPDHLNRLTKTSAVDTLQLRGLDTQRFVRKIGRVSSDTMKAIIIVLGPYLPVSYHKLVGAVCCLFARSHAPRGNATQDAPRPLPQSGNVGVPTPSVGTRT